MDYSQPTISRLFSQLGLDNDEVSIQRFARQHQLDNTTLLADAKFWNDSQADFIREQIWQDSDWAEVIDQLDNMLRQG
ncbi:DUF2789 domain-containing protein [Motilimonas pumila]|uniref:DUF2789 domain-containing protein n=1 Tax=Motilimonas pumila TaxID=2303987 RepID=A0A418YJQ3_9GAMM|nr:DUF2789 domain-containing protein [Motilimonas pumila]RJG51196.1 DUF2789 domain-containing protein [Motilimonas pumila]